jgi:protein O-GlcNAc transferase
MIRVVAILLATSAACASTPAPLERTLVQSNLCESALIKGQLDEAARCCDEALTVTPDDSKLWVNRGFVHLRRGEYAGARTAWVRALELDPQNAEAHHALGHLFTTRVWDPARGRRHLEEALRIAPGTSSARLTLAALFLESGDPERAIQQSRKVLEQVPGLATPHELICEAELQRAATAEAAEACRRAVQVDPSFIDAWAALGAVHLERWECDDAATAFMSCMEGETQDEHCLEGLFTAQILHRANGLREVEEARRSSSGE